jgi:hypothetical protein
VLLVPLQHMCVVDTDDGVARVYSCNTPILLRCELADGGGVLNRQADGAALAGLLCSTGGGHRGDSRGHLDRQHGGHGLLRIGTFSSTDLL